MSRLKRIYEAADIENRAAILRALQPRQGARLLDLGCADGAWTVELGKRVGTDDLHGFELLEESAAQARERGIETKVGSLAEPLPYADGEFDVVHSNQVIEHLANTDLFLSEIRRILASDGYLVISTNNVASWHNVVSLALGWQPPPMHISDELITGNPANFGEGTPGAYGQMHLRLFTHRAMAALAAHHGLRLEERGASGYYPFSPRVSRVMTRIDGRHSAYLVHRYVPA